MIRRLGAATSIALLLSLGACSSSSVSSSAPITIGGNLSGLVAGASVELQDGGVATTTLSVNGYYTLTSTVIFGASYDITVTKQPVGETCTVTNGSGTVNVSSVANILVACTPNPYTVSGTVSGLLPGSILTLQDNGGDSTTVSANGAFSFSSSVPSGANYAVTILTPPAGQSCAVANGSGVVAEADIANVAISCSDNTYNVGVTVTGDGASGLVLQDNGGDNLSVAANGSFNFNTPIASGSTYAVTILSQPLGETCTVANPSGTIVSSHIGNVTVSCTANLYPISVAVSGLLPGRSLILQDNGGNSTPVSANGTVQFSSLVASGANYAVTVFSQPAGQSCSVTNGSGTVQGAAVSHLGVACSDDTYNIGVAVSGLIAGQSLVLQDNGGDNLTVSANQSFNFPTPVPSGSPYAVTILGAPAGESCAVTNGSGTVVSSNITGIAVLCTPNPYTIGGTLSGLLSGHSLTLEDNGGNSTSLSVNGKFGFSGQLLSGSTYAVTLLSQPSGQTCTVSNGSGAVTSANISSVAIACADNTYNVTVTIAGLLAGETLVLQNNGGDNLTFTTNGSANFATPIASGSAYAVSLLSTPLGESCTVANGSGTITNSAVAVAVGCTPNQYRVSGAVSGLLPNNQVVLQDNGGSGGNTTTVAANTSFSFPSSVASGSTYQVTVATQPPGQTCAVTNGSGTIAGANVGNVSVNCADNTYNIGVVVSGLKATGLVLQDNSGDNLAISANGSVNFATPVPSGSAYAVSVLSNPTGQTCTVALGSGVVASSNITGIPVTCLANTYAY